MIYALYQNRFVSGTEAINCPYDKLSASMWHSQNGQWDDGQCLPNLNISILNTEQFKKNRSS